MPSLSKLVFWKKKHSGQPGSEPHAKLAIKVFHESAAPPDLQIDIVFIHGLTGSSYNTWCDPESGVHWPRDLLKTDIPEARIICWGYDADVTSFWGHASKNRLSEHAQNLLGDLARLREDTNSVIQPRNALALYHAAAC